MDSDGLTSTYTNNDWENSDPASGGYYNFNNPWWQCCDDNPFSGGSGLDGSGDPETCPCEWEYNEAEAILEVECPDC